MCESPASPCIWSTGKEFIQKDKGFCVQPVLTAAYPDFAACNNGNTSTTCAVPCKWFDAGFSTCPTAFGTPTCTGGAWNTEKCMFDCPKVTFNEAPTIAPMTCTHNSQFNTVETTVRMCKALTDQRTCQMDGCVWNPCQRDTTQDAAPPSGMQCPMGAPYFDDYTCGFSCPPTGSCKDTNVAGTVSTMQCFNFRTQSECPTTGCSWTEFPRPLFSQPFCHPAVPTVSGVKGDVKTIPASEWKMCLGQDVKACAAPCVGNNAADMIPEGDFCAPIMTPEK